MSSEEWVVIEDFPNYAVSDQGDIYNMKIDQVMSISYTNYGHTKITLTDLHGDRFTRSVAQLVAEAFVEAPNSLCNAIILLDGDLTHVAAENIAWRPQWFAWKYTRQLKEEQPVHYKNLYVRNAVTNEMHTSIVDAGVAEGLLFADIWESTYTGKACFPTGSVFEIL